VTATRPLVRVEAGDDAVTLITIDRPERLNALSLPTITALKEAFVTVGADVDTRVVILTGAGRGFSAGLDLKASGSSPVSEGLDGVAAAMRGQAYFADVVQALRAIPQPVIAAVNGVAVGGGFALTMGCDLRYAADSARFNVQALRIGLSAGESGLSFHLPRLLPAAPAFEWLLTNRFVDAAEAERVGLVARTVPDADLLAVTRSVAAELAGHDRDALCLAKATMWANLLAPSLDVALALESRAWTLAGGADDGG
jgi:enoyl-CoA hydratase/carnithine racemase